MANISFDCPNCGRPGKRVKPITLQSLITPDAVGRVSESQYRFCETRHCETVYFGEDGSTFSKNDLTVRVGVKENDAPRHVCYCFDHTIEGINDEVQQTGKSTVLDDIKSRMETACWCETKSPQGGCCLGTVGKYVKQAMAEHGYTVGANEIRDVEADCCATASKPNIPAKDKKQRAGMFAVGGSVLSAIAASACCWLPLLLIAFGASAGGVAAWFEQYRPIFLSVAVILLAAGFYLVYRPSPICCEPNSPCAVPRPKVQKFNRVMIWVAAVLVVGFALFPNYAAHFIASDDDGNAASQAETNGQKVTLSITGMTCEACAAGLKNELSQTPGVAGATVNYDVGTAIVILKEEDPASINVLTDAVNEAGYQVTQKP